MEIKIITVSDSLHVNNDSNVVLKVYSEAGSNERYDKAIREWVLSEIAKLGPFRQEVVESLESITEPNTSTLYLLPVQDGSGNEYFDEYVYAEAKDGIPAHFERIGRGPYIPDHQIENDPSLNKLIVTIRENGVQKQYAIAREALEAPANPTFSPASGGSGNGSLAVTISTATSGATIQYKIGSGSWQTGTSVTLQQDTAQESKSYTLTAKAVKNGLESAEVIATYTVKRKVATPTIGLPSSNKYASSRTVQLSCSTTGAKIYYTTNGDVPTTSSSYVTSGSTITLSSAGTYTIKAMAVVDDWVNSSVQTKFSNGNTATVVVGANKCYIGQAANITSVADIKNLAHSYEQDTLVDSTVDTIDFGSTFEYVWFCIPNTAAKNLAVSSGNVPVPLSRLDNGTWIDDDPAGNLIPATGTSIYRVWRTKNRINSTFTFKFE